MFAKKITLICSILMVTIVPTFAAAGIEVRNITPPKIDAANIGKKILCYRPMRHGTPNLSLQKKNSKIIVHNYGHGGSGWTLAPGSAYYVNNLLLDSKDGSKIKKETAITIIGGGALGLFTAYDLAQRGFTNLTILAENFDDLTSHHAGGLFAPISMDNNPQMQKIVDKIGIDSYLVYASIGQKKHEFFKTGAAIIPAYFKNRDDSGLEAYVGKVIQPAKDVTLDFGNGTRRDVVVYDDGIFIDTYEMMNNLRQYLDNKGTKFVKKRVQSFEEIADKIIINCSGSGSKELNDDSNMEEIQGHLIMLKNQNPEYLQHMILFHFDEGKTISGQKIKRSFYIFPKRLPNSDRSDIGIIGGTFIENASGTTPNEEEFATVVQGAKNFYGIK